MILIAYDNGCLCKLGKIVTLSCYAVTV